MKISAQGSPAAIQIRALSGQKNPSSFLFIRLLCSAQNYLFHVGVYAKFQVNSSAGEGETKTILKKNFITPSLFVFLTSVTSVTLFLYLS